MTCRHCADKGIIRVRYQGGDVDDFALCLCDAGQAWRNERNAYRDTYPLWHVWAARNQVEHARIGPIEEWHDASELRAMFPGYMGGVQAAADDDVLLAAARTRRGKL